jgi:hypothetical protein
VGDVAVPDLAGKTRLEALAILDTLGFKDHNVVIDGRKCPKDATICASEPAAGSKKVPLATRIVIYSGPEF